MKAGAVFNNTKRMYVAIMDVAIPFFIVRLKSRIPSFYSRHILILSLEFQII